MWAFISYYYLWTILVFINKNLELMLVYHEIILLINYIAVFYTFPKPHNLLHFVITNITMIHKIGNQH